MSHIAGSLNAPRQNHGMSVKKIGKTFKLITFGGESEEGDGLLDSIEVWNSQSETWEEPNSKRFKLRDKTSRFSTLTMFNGSRLTKSTNFSSSSTKNEPKKPFTQLNVFQGTRYIESGTFFLTIVVPINILTMICIICRLLPEALWMTLKIVAWYEMIMQSSYLSMSFLIGTENHHQGFHSFVEHFLTIFSHSVIMLPEQFDRFIRQFLNIVSKLDSYATLSLGLFNMLPLIFSRLFYYIAFNARLSNMYHETLQVILFLSFLKISSTLKNLNKLSKRISFLQLLTRLVCDPMVSLLIVTLLMNSVPFLRIVSLTMFIIHVVYNNYLDPKEDFPAAIVTSIAILLFTLPMIIMFDCIPELEEIHQKKSLNDGHLSAFLISRHQSLKYSTLDMFYYTYLSFCTLSMKSMCNE